jgi:excisionase family DNA binding protein
MPGRRWTVTEQTFVVDRLTIWRIETIAAHLGRTPKAVIRWCERHGQAVCHQDLWTTGMVGAAIGRSDATVRRWAREGRIPARRVPGGRRWLIDPARLEGVYDR